MTFEGIIVGQMMILILFIIILICYVVYELIEMNKI